MQFNPGDMVRHKATRKRCVVKSIDEDRAYVVTTQDDEIRVYDPVELEPYN